MLLSFICKQNSRTWLSAVAYWWCVLGSISLLAVWCSWQYLCEVCCQGGWPQCTQHSHWSQALPYCLFTRLSNLFHGMDKNTPVRYTVYCSLIKVAASCGAIQYIPTELDQVRKWISDWNLTTEKKHTLLRLLYEALVDCKKRYSELMHCEDK